ncbi:hypothetical protein VE03_09713 [Pseudogymnoascus sp. 23342-1-I1]|nr:hypothetical protein VE03_09713 [Pseudogymnoascus sp. 23342-1-I1]
MSRKPKDRLETLVLAWDELAFRSTSHSANRFLIFVSLASSLASSDKDRNILTDVLAVSEEERMKTWLLRQEVVPVGFLFVRGPRLQTAGLRWVPRTANRYNLPRPEQIVSQDEGIQRVLGEL